MKPGVIFVDRVSHRFDILQEEMKDVSTKDFSIKVRAYEKIVIKIGINSVPLAGYINGESVEDFSIAYFRHSYKEIELARPLALAFVVHEIPVFDSALLATPYGGKLYQYAKLSRAGYSVPPTLFYSKDWVAEKFDEIATNLGMPFVMKDLYADRGECNFLVKTEEEFQENLSQNPEAGFLFQKFIPNDFDYRVFMTGGKIAVLYERRRKNPGEHRNNVYLGGEMTYVDSATFDPQLVAICEGAVKEFQLEVAGVDLVVSTEGDIPYIFEVNNSPYIEAGPLVNATVEFLKTSAKNQINHD